MRKRLQQAESDARQVQSLNQSLAELGVARDSLAEKLKRHSEIDKRQSELLQLERTVTEKLIRAEVYELRVAQAELRAKDAKEIVALVFQNNRFKYRETSSDTVPNTTPNVYPSTLSVSSNKYVEGES